MDFDLDLMETSIDNNEVSSLEQTYENNNRILEAVLVADKLEQQYRMQGYSEAQIQQFHEKFMDKVKGFFGKKPTTMDKVKGAASSAWEWVKKMVAKFVTWCKKIWIKITSIFKNDLALLEKYKDVLKKTTVTVRVPYNNNKASGIKGPILTFSLTSSSTYEKHIEDLKPNFGYTDKKYSYDGLVSYVKSIDISDTSKKAQQEAIKAAKKMTGDPDKIKLYIKYLNARLNYDLKWSKAAHSEVRKAIITAIAQYRKTSNNEAVEILEQQITDVQYVYESLIDEGNTKVQSFIEQAEF